MRPRLPEEPRYADDGVRELSQELETAYERRAEVVAAGGDVADVDSEIFDLKRRLREGGLQAGDLLTRRFQLLEMLGQGRFATVWKANDRDRGAVVAIKVLHDQYRLERGPLERYFLDTRAMAGLEHPGIVRVVEEHVEDEGWHFFVMEHLDAGDLRQTLRTRLLTLADRLWIVLEVGDALTYAHARGRVHGDIKPANILLDDDGRPKLTDLGLSAAFESRTSMLGTVIYTAPELMQAGAAPGPAADVYGLGMTAAFLLYGEDLPLEALRDPSAFILGLDAPSEVLAVLALAVARRKEQRIGSVAGLCRELRVGLAQAEGAAAETLAAVEESRTDSSRPPMSPAAASWASVPRIAALRAAVSRVIAPRDSEAVSGEDSAAKAADGITTDGERIHPADGTRFVYVPGGELIQGAADLSEWEKPVHRVHLSPFWIARHAVTNAQYRRFLKDNPAHPEPALWDHEHFCQDRQPVVGVSWEDASAYCRWAGLALPSEAQWEAAACGTDQRRYPWGNDPPTAEHANFDGRAERTVKVGSCQQGSGPYGTCEQSGNVWEWCLDGWGPEAYAAREEVMDPVTDQDTAFRAVRGGSWDDPPELLVAAYRFWYPMSVRVRFVGFRCVLAATAEE